MAVDLEQLRGFLYEFNKEHGYGSEDESEWVKNPDGSKLITWSKDNFRVEDKFWGGEPYSGITMVWRDEKPFWSMAYYGAVSPHVHDIGRVYGFLKSALREAPIELPLRGPKSFTEGELGYSIEAFPSHLDRFHLSETILDETQGVVYSAWFVGGLVDQREE